MKDITSALISAAEAGRLRLRSIVLLDWRDGPVEGIVEASSPTSYWLFRMVGERTTRDDLDDRLYLLAHIPESALEPILAIVGSPDSKPLTWPFDAHTTGVNIAAVVDAAISAAGEPSLLAQSRGFRSVGEVWHFTGWQYPTDH